MVMVNADIIMVDRCSYRQFEAKLSHFFTTFDSLIMLTIHSDV